MIQATGLTSTSRRDQPPAVDDLTFEALPGRVTALFGALGAGKTTALRLLLQLDHGHGTTLFRGRTLDRLRHPAREIGVMLDDIPGHPGRTVRGQLSMLAAAAGVPGKRVDRVLRTVGLAELAYQRLGELPVGTERRLGIAAALTGDPHTLVLDEPAHGLSTHETAWLTGLLRDFAERGGTVLLTSRDPHGVTRLADRVLTLDAGRLVADQPAEEFARTRGRPRIAVRSPLAARLATLIEEEARTAHLGERLPGSIATTTGQDTTAPGAEPPAESGPWSESQHDPWTEPGPVPESGRDFAQDALAAPRPEAPRVPAAARDAGAEAVAGPEAGAGAEAEVAVVQEDDNLISVYGVPCASVGETAYRHGIVVHRLAEEIADTGPVTPRPRPSSDRARKGDGPRDPGGSRGSGKARGSGGAGAAPRELTGLPLPCPAWPLRYELRRATGVRTGWLIAMITLVVSAAVTIMLGGSAPAASELHRLTGWSDNLPLPPVVIACGLLGARAFGEEYRFPVLDPAHETVPHGFGLLRAKLVVSAVSALLLSLATLAVDGAGLLLLFGGHAVPFPDQWPVLTGSVCALAVGSAWAGLLAAGVFRSTAFGLTAVLAVPLGAAPTMEWLSGEPWLRPLGGVPEWFRTVAPDRLPTEVDRAVSVLLRLVSQPVGQAMVLSIIALVCAYAVTGLRGRARQ